MMNKPAISLLASRICESRAKLRHECEAAADVIQRPVEYVQSISRARYKTIDLRSLSAKQLWSLVFDIRRNAQRRRKKAGISTEENGEGTTS